MSTRCHTIISKNDNKAYIYRHSDGYPSGAGEDLKEFINLNKENVIDKWSINDFAAELNKFYSGFEFENKRVHGDEDYIYFVDLDNKQLKCYNVKIHVRASENLDDLEEVFVYEF